jgi:hypothetical protein
MPSPPRPRISSNSKRRRFLKPKQHKATANAATGNSGRVLALTAASALVVVTVTVVEAAAPEGVTVAGEKLHEDPVGKPEQAKETAELNPFSGVIETVAVALCPPVTVCDAGVAAAEKSGAGRLMV